MNRSSGLTVELSDELVASLKEMAERHGSTMTDAIERSIKVQQYLGKQLDNGKKLLLEDPKTKTAREHVLPKH